MPETESCDVLVIGAGLLGCFSARNLRAYHLSVTVLEAREDVCTGISKANTAIVYTGCDTRPGTLKTELCVKANEGFDALCAQLGVPFSRCGSLMTAFGPHGEQVLQKKYTQGVQNGVRGLRLLSAEETRRMEPNLSEKVTAALYAPGTGTVDPWLLCVAAYENAAANGADFRFHSAVTAMERTAGGFCVRTGDRAFFARAVLNCAGRAAHTVREMTEAPLVRIFPSGADYFVMDKNTAGGVSHVIFQEPETGKKGLTLVPTTDGTLLVGPSERDGTGEPDASDADNLRSLEALCGEVVPQLDLSKRIRCFAGARPNPYYVEPDGNGVYRKSDRSINGFTVLEEAGLFSLIGIKTPGLTCAHELTKYMAAHIAQYLGCSERNNAFSPVRTPIPKLSEMTFEARQCAAQRDPAFGRIVCKCGDISEGEIIEAIARGAKTVNGVKRRVSTGMGCCQGSRCTAKIAALIARERAVPLSAVTLDGCGSEIVKGGGE